MCRYIVHIGLREKISLLLSNIFLFVSCHMVISTMVQQFVFVLQYLSRIGVANFFQFTVFILYTVLEHMSWRGSI